MKTNGQKKPMRVWGGGLASTGGVAGRDIADNGGRDGRGAVAKPASAKRFSALLCVLLLGACGGFGAADGAGAPYRGVGAEQPDPNCDRYATSGGGAPEGCLPAGRGKPRDRQGQQRIP